MGVRAHARFASNFALSSLLSFPFPCICTIFLVGGGDNAFILSNSILPRTFPINNSTYSLFVLLFLVHVHVTVSVMFYVVVCYNNVFRGGWE